MFVYENGLPVDYIYQGYSTDPEIIEQVRQHMLNWYRDLPGLARVRVGKRDMIIHNSEVNLRRLENE